MYTNEPPRNKTRGQQEVEDFIRSDGISNGQLVLSLLVVLLVVLGRPRWSRCIHMSHQEVEQGGSKK